MINNALVVFTILLSLSISPILYNANSAEGDSAKGKQMFVNTCSSCHGAEGKGDGIAAAALDPKPRDLSDANYVSSLSDEHMYNVISKGGTAVGKSAIMPAWGGVLSDQDIWNVIAHIRNDLCKCKPK